jgi:hypothetical protein
LTIPFVRWSLGNARTLEALMHAIAGDIIAVPGTHVGEAGRTGTVLETRGPDGSPPYLVRWDDGHEALCYPGPEIRVQHDGHLVTGS